MQFVVFFSACIAGTFGTLALVSSGHPLVFLMTADPVVVLVAAAVTLAVVSFLAGWMADEYSWVDRLWSVAPVMYAWFIVARSPADARLWLAAILVTLWGARLTFNFARKGGYTGMEDYRWREVRKFIGNEFLWQAFNLLFISVYQNGLFVLFVLPLALLAGKEAVPLNALDFVAAAALVALLIFETLADRQQWEFQNRKAAAREGRGAPDDDTKRGFLTGGLFACSRHPNYFGEIGIWWMVYLFGVAGSGKWLGWSVAGPVLLTLLFQGSTMLTEKLSLRKYPAYAEYKKRVSKIIPWFPKPSVERSRDEEKTETAEAE